MSQEDIQRTLVDGRKGVEAFLRDYDLAIRSAKLLVPQYEAPPLFADIRLKRAEIEASFTIRLDSPRSRGEAPPESIRMVSQVESTAGTEMPVQDMAEDKRPPMRLLFYDKNKYGSYWDTPEGRAFAAGDTGPYDR